MDAKNLAIMFGPTLVRKKGDDTVSLVTDMSDQCRIVESIILHVSQSLSECFKMLFGTCFNQESISDLLNFNSFVVSSKN